MKEAAGEANMTVVTIIIIGVVVAIATPIISNLVQGTKKSSCCTNNGGTWYNNKCYSSCSVGANGSRSCSGSVSTTCS